MSNIRFRIAAAALASVVCLGQVWAQDPGTQTPGNRERQDRTPQTTPDRTPQGQQRTPSATNQAAQPTGFLDRAIEMNRAEIQFGHLAMTKSQNTEVQDFANMIVRDHTQALKKLEALQTSTSTSNQTRSKSQVTDPDGSRTQTDTQSQDRSQTETTTREKPTTMNTMDQGLLTREHQRELDRLSNLSGQQFDRQFIDLMIREHRTAIDLFEREAGISGTTSKPSSQQQTPGAGDQPHHPGTARQDPTTTASNTAEIARELLPTLRQHLTRAEQIQKQLK